MPSNKFDDDMPKIRLDKEDREAFRQSRSKGNYSASVAPTSADAAMPTQSAPVAAKGGASGVVITLLVFLILAGFGFSYWLYQEQTKLVSNLSSAQARILDLEQQLSATGEEMGESTVAIQAKVKQLDAKSKELWDQMDKLWASAWRRNQSEIKGLTGKIDGLSSSDKELDKQLRDLNTEISTSMTNLDLLQEQINKHGEDIAKVSTDANTVKQTASSQGKKVTELTRKLATAEKVNNALLKRINDLEKWQKTQVALKSNRIKKEPPKKALPPPITVGA